MTSLKQVFVVKHFYVVIIYLNEKVLHDLILHLNTTVFDLIENEVRKSCVYFIILQ